MNTPTPANPTPLNTPPTALNPWGGSVVLPESCLIKQARLFDLLKSLSFKRGQFTLASGKTSSWYMDCRMSALSGEGSWLIGQLFYHALQYLERPVSTVGGMVLGAAPLVTSVTAYSAFVGQPIDGFLVRKEAKAHGGNKQIEGHLNPYSRVVLVEDVVTTGGSTLKAIAAIRQQFPHVDVVGVLALVDRHAGARERFLQQGVPLHTLFGIDAFLQE